VEGAARVGRGTMADAVPPSVMLAVLME
jgi:hypothetical protein